MDCPPKHLLPMSISVHQHHIRTAWGQYLVLVDEVHRKKLFIKRSNRGFWDSSVAYSPQIVCQINGFFFFCAHEEKCPFSTQLFVHVVIVIPFTSM